MEQAFIRQEKQRFTLRKYSFGLASVLIGSTLLFGGMSVKADETSASVNTEPVLADSSTVSGEVSSDVLEAPLNTEIIKNFSEKEAPEMTSEVTEEAADSSVDGLKASEGVTSFYAKPEKENPVIDDSSNSTLAPRGTYHFDGLVAVKNEPVTIAPTEFYFDKGYSVNYDKILQNDGHDWISYISYNGMRRYADLGKSQNSQPAPKSESKPKVTEVNIQGNLTITNQTSSGFDVVVSEVTSPQGIVEVQVPVWSEQSGQDDLVWYRATKESDGNYRARVSVKDHKNSRGAYNIHLYYALANGKQVIVSGTKTTVPSPYDSSNSKLAPRGTYHFDGLVAVKNEPVTTAPTEFYFDKGYSVNYDKILQNDGHDWLSYISYNGMRRYADLGKSQNSQLAPKSESKPKVTEVNIQGNLTITNQTSSGFDVVVSEVTSPQGIVEVQVPVWSEQSGQDDLVWYRATKESDGNYRARVSIKDHKNSRGEYNIHLYYALASGKQVIVSGTKTNVPEQPKGLVSGDIAIQPSSYGFDVLINNAASPKGIKEVQVPVWSEQGGQDDIQWYTAQQQDNGDYKVSVAISHHHNNQGNYHIHLYYLQKDGSLTFVTGQTTKVKMGADKHMTEPSFNGSYYSVPGKYGEVIIVNKKYALSPNYNPGENPVAKDAFVRLRNDMMAQGYSVGYGYSGFRSFSYQTNLYNNYVYRDGKANADRYSARPGHSEHQTGLAYDLTDRQGNLLEEARASQWLKENAHHYGFIVRYLPNKEHITGFMSETWHIRYIGREAEDIYRSGLTLEEYFGVDGGGYQN